jgi:ribonuclease HII
MDYNEQYKGYIGIDESGRGCAGGELVFAGVKLHTNGDVDFADDSKKTTHKQREEMVDKIKSNVQHCTVIKTAEEIDEKGLSLCLKECLETIIEYFGEDEKYLYDGNKTFGVDNPNLETLVKADAKVKTVGAASIIAKHTKDLLMQQHHIEFPQYGWDTNAGYITKKHVQAILEHGYTKYHRKSYKIKELEDKEIKDKTDFLF